MPDDLLSHADGPVHRLTLNRPARRNALTPELARWLASEIERVEVGEARVILLGGAGGHFCTGLDLHWLYALGPAPTVPELQHGLSDFQSAILGVVRCPVPVVAVMQGAAAGFGLDLALACDLRVAGTSATFTSAFARMGLVPDGGSTFTLPRLVGVGRALRLLMAGETLGAEAALHVGLVDEVVEDGLLEGAVRRLVEGLLANSPSSVRAIKRLSRSVELGALEQALSAEGAVQLQALQGAEFRRRLEAFAARAGAAEPV
jgi:enoyl-CoA hydratase/carnithine racemase